MNNYEIIDQKFNQGKTFYLKNNFDSIVLKCSPNGFFAKFTGQNPYPIKENTKLVTDTILLGDVITEIEFNRY
jgi:hypothetical protein